MLAAVKRQITEPVRQPKPVLKPLPKPRRKPRTKSFPVYRLYPASQPEPQEQAETLLREIQMYAEDAIGKYIPTGDLERLYGELCEREGWRPKHWSVVGHALGKLTDKVCKKTGGKRFNAYKIPRVCA